MMCVSALPYIADPLAAAGDWYRVLRRSGSAVVTAWAENGLTYPLLLRQAAAQDGIEIPDPNASFGSPERLEQLLDRAGFSQIQIQRQTYQASGADPLSRRGHPSSTTTLPQNSPLLQMESKSASVDAFWQQHT